MDIRPATRKDLLAFYGAPPPRTVRAWAAVNGGDRPLAIGGYYRVGDCICVFTDNDEDMSKRDRVRAARWFMDKVSALGIEMVALSDYDGEVALKHFGFQYDGALWRLVPSPGDPA